MKFLFSCENEDGDKTTYQKSYSGETTKGIIDCMDFEEVLIECFETFFMNTCGYTSIEKTENVIKNIMGK